MPAAAEAPLPPPTVWPELMRQMEDAVLEMVDDLWCLIATGTPGGAADDPSALPEDDPDVDTLEDDRAAPPAPDVVVEDREAEKQKGVHFGGSM